MTDRTIEPRAVRRARARMTRGGRWGAKAAVLAAVYDARAAVDRAVAARRARVDRQSAAGVMPHKPSGKHGRKLAERRLDRGAS